MQIEILTIFPGYFDTPLRESLLGKAIAAGKVDVTVTDLRTFAEGRHRKVDDEPYGGGAGMVMMAPVVAAAIEARREAPGRPRARTVLMAPEGRRLDQEAAASAGGPREASDRLRPLRRDRRAGPGPRALRRGDFPGRLRSAGRRGGGAGAHGGGLTPAPRRGGRGRIARKRVLSPGAAGLSPLHAAAGVPGPGGAGGPPFRRPPQDRGVSPGPGPRADPGAAAGPAGAEAPRAGRRGSEAARLATRVETGRVAPMDPVRLEFAVSDRLTVTV